MAADSNSTSNELSAGVVSGAVVQAGVVHGGVHVVGSPREHLVPRQLPAPPQPFVGREDDLAVLDAALGPGGTPVLISAIRGAGGIGKTWLALHWAHRHRDRFPDGQLFVDLRGFSPDSAPMQPAAVIRGFLDALGVDPGRIPVEPQAQAALFRSLAAGRRMLILLDNAADTDQAVPLLPGGDRCLVVVTSRRTLDGLITRHGGRHVTLNMLPDEDAHALLTAKLGPDRLAAEPDAATELIRFCRGFALALGLIASQAQLRPHLPLSELVTELHDLGLAALDNEDPVASLPAVFSMSVRVLTQQQRTVFALLGIAPGPDISLPAAADLTGLSTLQIRAVLVTLEEASLLERHPGGRYRMHDLIRSYATTTANDLSEAARDEALRRVLDFYIHSADSADRLLDPHRPPHPPDRPEVGAGRKAPSDLRAALDWFNTEQLCLSAAQSTAFNHGWHRDVWRLAWVLDTFYYRTGRRDDQLAAWQAALNGATRLADPALLTIAHRRLGFVRTTLGEYEVGIDHLFQALELASEQKATDQQAETRRMLAWALLRAGSNQQALENATQALSLYRTLKQPAGEANALNAAGWCAAKLGQYDDARSYCEAALLLHRSNLNLDGEANALDSLAYVAHHSGDHRQAVRGYRHAIALSRTIGDTSQVGSSLEALGHPYVALGEYVQAGKVWQEALDLYRQQGRTADAERLRQQLDVLDHSAGQ